MVRSNYDFGPQFCVRQYGWWRLAHLYNEARRRKETSISQSEAEWIRERNYWDAVATERTIREEAEIRGLESGMQRGMEQGLQRGMEQGLQQKAVETAINFLKMKLGTIEQIAQGTGLSLEEVQELAAKAEASA